MSYDITMTRWLPEERHLRKSVSHGIFEWILVKILNLICEYYILLPFFRAFTEFLTTNRYLKMSNFMTFIVANVLAMAFFYFF